VAGEIAEGFVRIRADTGSVKSDVQTGVGGALKSVAKIASAALVAAGVFQIGKSIIGDFNALNKVTAQTRAVLKSTEGVAGVTTKSVRDLANAIGDYSGIDDVAIQAGENMLLTFKNVRNEAGRGNDVFTQSTKVLADMSTALGTDMSQSAIGLGKALNDPIKGVTALQRVGVTFNDAQKKTIETMVKSGNVIGAQKVILAELRGEFGGSAKAAGQTLSGQINILKDNFSDMGVAILQRLLPVLLTTVRFITSEGLPAIKSLGGFIADTLSPITDLVGRFQALRDDGNSLGSALQLLVRGVLVDLGVGFGTASEIVRVTTEVLHTIVDVFFEVIAAGQGVFGFIMDHQEVFGALAAGIGIAVVALVALSTAMVIGTAVSAAFGVALAFAFSPITIIVVAIALLVAGIILLYRNSQTARAIMDAAWSAIQVIVVTTLHTIVAVVRSAMTIVRGVVNVVLGLIHGDFGQVWTGIQQIVRGSLGILVALIRGVVPLMLAAAKAIGQAILDGIVSLAKQAPGKVADLIKGIPKAIGNVSHLLFDVGADLIRGLVDGIGSMFGSVKDKLGGLTDSLTGWKGPPARDKVLLSANGRLIIQGLIDGINAEIPNVEKTLTGIGPMLQDTIAARTAAVSLGPVGRALPASGASGRGQSFASSPELLRALETSGGTTVHVDQLTIVSNDPDGIMRAILNETARSVV
jgi:phage-related protein